METNKTPNQYFNHINDPDVFRKTAHELVDLLASELAKSDASIHTPTLNWISPDEQLEYWRRDLGAEKITDPVLLFRDILKRSMNVNRRGNVGHQLAVPYPVTVLTTALMAHLNNGMGVYEAGMVGNALEKIIIQELASLFGLPEKSTGFITSGGSLGNLTAMLAARAHYLKNRPKTVYNQLAILVSEEAHYSVDRAFIVMGIPKENVIKIPVDRDFRLRTELLDAYLTNAEASGKSVFCVVGCACTTATGSYDNLRKIGQFARQNDLWFHVDAAHGGPAIFSATYKTLLDGIEKADSVILDFHKMMSVPSLSTAVVFRNAGAPKHTFSQDAKYLWQDQQLDEWYNSGKQTFECTKPMSIIHVYTVLRLYGYDIYQKQVDYLYDLAAGFSSELRQDPAFELLCTPQSNIVCFRYLDPSAEVNKLNKDIQKKIVEAGDFYIVGTTSNDKYYLRVSLMNPRTRIEDLQVLKDLITTTAKEL